MSVVVSATENPDLAFYDAIKIDIEAYFSRIDHAILLTMLMRLFKGDCFQKQLVRIVNACSTMENRGLPIGSLTSQYFANYYLDGLDRFLTSHGFVRAVIRYMDDIIWWCDTRKQARKTLNEVNTYLESERALTIKQNRQILPSRAGVTFCGFRIAQGIIRLSRRRKRSIRNKRLYWEQQYRQGNINSCQLQTAHAAVHAISQGADSLEWRKKQLLVNPPLDV